MTSHTVNGHTKQWWPKHSGQKTKHPVRTLSLLFQAAPRYWQSRHTCYKKH